jgi:tripeptide aminopeptidase
MKTVSAILTALLAAGPAAAQSAQIQVDQIREHALYESAMDFIDQDYPRFVDELIELTEIPAPPFAEQERGEVYLEKLRALGLDDVEQDAEGNVMGIRLGTGDGLLAIAAHLDTVFPEGTDVTVQRRGTQLSAPGVGDDTSGLTTLLAVIRALDAAGMTTDSSILFVGDVGEEGIGDLRGMKYLFGEGAYSDQIDMFVSIEGGRQLDITTQALGSKRFRVTFRGPGGHSYSAFGLVNPAFALGTAMAKLGSLEVPESPKTTYSVGRIGGGTSVNSIPFESWMEVDLRSEGNDELEELAQDFLALVQDATDEENASRSTGQGAIELDIEMIGERPSGETPIDSPIVQLTTEVYRAFGIEPSYNRSSTDSNIPISLGVPAITIDRGGMGGRSHSLEEWVDVSQPETVKGIQVVLTTILALAGLNE